MAAQLAGVLLLGVAVAAEPPKRGFSGFAASPPNGSVGLNPVTGTCYDAAALGLQDSWFYNWLDVPYYSGLCDDHHQAAEYVPMVGAVGQADRIMNVSCGAQKCSITDNWITSSWLTSGSRYLLGYNEPDGHEGGKCTPAEAARDWVKVQQLAALFDPPLILVSPAPVSGPGVGPEPGFGPDGVSPWMDQFLGNCSEVVPECDPSLIKYIAMHDYHGNASGMMQRVRGAAARYGRKVWVTEFAILHWGAPPPRSAMDALMKEVLPQLDASPDVYRYAWFSARNTVNEMNGGSNLLPSTNLSMTPTSTGDIYRLNK